MATKQMGAKIKKKNLALKIFKIFFLTLLSITILAGVASTGVILAMIKTAPPLDVNQIINLDQPSILYDDKGNKMDTVITKQKRTVIHMDSIPKNLSNAFISIEDERFRTHIGIDIKRVAGVFYTDIINKIHNEGGVQGASTITQQLIKNRMFLSDSLENRLSPKRKVQEMYLATKLEKVLTKDQILEAYMNTIFLGGQANGVESAANQYFGKSAKDLNLIECAFIAGLGQSPSAYYPFSSNARKNPNIYLNRTKTVLFKMHENNYIDDKQYSDALNDLANNKLKFTETNVSLNKYEFEWFSIPVMEQVRQDLKAQYHYTNEQIDSILTNGGLKIYTTMNRDMENAAVKIINSDSSYGFDSVKDKNGIIQPQASASVVDYHTGQVKVLVGGRGDQPPNSYNRAAYSSFLRPVGSSIKPLSVYSPAIETKAFTASSIIDDSRLSSVISNKYGGYQPNNDDFSFSGPITLRNALMRSVNLVAVKIEDRIGVTLGASYAEKFGLSLNIEDKRSTSIAAMALGQLHYGSNTMTMAAAYGVFGNNGIYNPPKLYTKVIDSRGVDILDAQSSPRKVLSPQAAYIMYDLLKGPVSSQGTGPDANFGSMPVAGKTGTTTEMRDLWFCGLTPYYSGSVWIGRDDNGNFSDSTGAKSNTAAGVWGKIMEEVNSGLPIKDIDMPEEGIYTVGNELYLEGTAPSSIEVNPTVPSNIEKSPVVPDTKTTEPQAQNQNKLDLNNGKNTNQDDTTNKDASTNSTTKSPSTNTTQTPPDDKNKNKNRPNPQEPDSKK